MKRIFSTRMIVILLLLLHNMGYAKELKLITQIHWIDNDVVKTRDANFRAFFIPNPGSDDTFRVSYDQSNEKQFNELKKILRRMQNDNDSFFHVLRVFYGLDVSSKPYKIKLIYLPDQAIHTTGKNFKYKTDIITNPKVYMSGDFTSSYMFNDVKSYIDNYKTNGKIQVYPNGATSTGRDLNFCPLGSNCDASYDAEGVVFPFQEIEDFYDLTGTKPIYIISVAEMDESHGNNFYKHGIVFSTDLPGVNMDDAISANLGALCPPRCQDINVRLAFGGWAVGTRFRDGRSPHYWIYVAGGMLLGFLGFFIISKFRTRKNAI